MNTVPTIIIEAASAVLTLEISSAAHIREAAVVWRGVGGTDRVVLADGVQILVDRIPVGCTRTNSWCWPSNSRR
jgi:hypothetical protein